jgi:uncharacterized membrane protein
MPELFVVGFRDNIHRASGVLDELRVLDDQWIRDLADAVAVHRDVDGTVAMDQGYRPTGRRAAEWGGTLGVLIGVSLSIPYLAGGSGSIAEGVMTAAGLARVGLGGVEVSFWKDTLGIPEEFLKPAGQQVLPGDSAIFAILDAFDSAPAARGFQRYGGTILQLSLDAHLRSRILRLLEDGASPHES